MTDALAWAVARGAHVLLDELLSGRWHPGAAERQFAEDLARGQWTSGWLRAALRDIDPAVRAGRLLEVLDPAVAVTEAAVSPARDAALAGLRRLLDAAAPPGETDR